MGDAPEMPRGAAIIISVRLAVNMQDTSVGMKIGQLDFFLSQSVRYRRPEKGRRMNFFDEISLLPSVHARHEAAPLLREREQ